jgi:hypothetical protein
VLPAFCARDASAEWCAKEAQFCIEKLRPGVCFESTRLKEFLFGIRGAFGGITRAAAAPVVGFSVERDGCWEVIYSYLRDFAAPNFADSGAKNCTRIETRN